MATEYPRLYETRDEAEREAASMMGWDSPHVIENEPDICGDVTHCIAAIDPRNGRLVVERESGIFS
jgi:hypothetical protein